MTNIKNTAKTPKLPRLAVLAAVLLSCATFPALAQVIPAAPAAPKPAATPCDPTYSQSLNARAWLEAQRELTQNQNLIYKPDSVLEYTCFNNFLNTLAQQADAMFSDNTTRWGGGDAKALDTALEGLVEAAVKQYIDANFENTGAGGSYDLLGGRLTGVTTVPLASLAAGDRDHIFPVKVTPGGYSCKIMNDIWKAAKCVDSIANPAEDGYFTFTQYGAGTDKRYLPMRCGSIAARWTSEYNTALVTANTPWTEDAFLTFVGNFQHKKTPAAVGCAHIKPVPTGLKVVSKEFADYNEKVCFAPGCYYDPKDDKCAISK